MVFQMKITSIGYSKKEREYPYGIFAVEYAHVCNHDIPLGMDYFLNDNELNDSFRLEGK